MGSIGYLMGGAMAGLGQGLEKVGAESEKEQQIQKEQDWRAAMDATHIRLQAAEEAKRQQSQQQFQHTETETAAGRNVAAAGAQRQFLTEQEAAKEAAAQKRVETTGKYRVQARLVGAPPRKPIPEFTHKTLTEQGSMGKDPTTGKPVILPGRSYDLLNHRSGQGFVAVGDMYLPYDASQTQFPASGSIGRAPAAAAQNVIAHPETMMDFFRAYHYIPRDAVTALQQQKDQQSDAGLPKFVPKGTTAGPETGLGGNASGNQQDAEDEAEDYANTGDEGPQESDNAPAQ